MRIWLVGFGTVGQWLARVLDERAGQPGLAHLRQALGPEDEGFAVQVVSSCTRQNGCPAGSA